MPRAVLVDLGETLFREEPMDRRASAEALAADPRFNLPGAAELLRMHEEGASGAETWTVLGWLSTLLPRPLAEEAEIVVWDHAVRMKPMPGAREALAALRAAGAPVGVVSNTRFSGRAWRHGLDRHGLDVDFVVSSADVKARKPDPAIFRAALEKLGLPPSDVWFVGDTLEKDVRGALAAGMRPIWFGGPRGPLAPCPVAADWPAAVAILLP
jgi:putative hydrolase of the HAD superfamily